MALEIIGSDNQVASLFQAGVVGMRKGIAIRFRRRYLSPGWYTNNRGLSSHPALWSDVLVPMISFVRMKRKHFDAIASVATGGISHGAVIAWEVGLPHVVVKKTEKTDQNLPGLIDGDIAVLKGAQVLLIEDMSTTFESALAAMKAIRAVGGNVTDALLINTYDFPIFRRNIEGVNVHAVCTGKQMLDYAASNRIVDSTYEKLLRGWLRDPDDEDWSKTGEWKMPKAT